MPAHDITEARYAQEIALYRWGPTGFRCQRCGHDRAYRLRRSPRARQCASCRKQQSVTTGTVMHGTKLPLNVWVARGQYYENGDMPSANSFAKEHGIASSSSWHLGQRVMAALDLGQGDPLDWAGHMLLNGLKCRRPKPLREESDAEAPVSRKAEKFHWERKPLVHELILGTSGRDLVLTDSCPAESAVAKARSHPIDLRLAYRHVGVERWITAILHRLLRTVCVRWTARYVRHLLLLWNRRQAGDTQPAPWLGQLLAGPRRPLQRLRAAALRA